MTQRIEITKTLLGKLTVKYDCPRCMSRLSSPLHDAGTTDTCPDCHLRFIVPGLEELERRKNAEAMLAKSRQEQKQQEQKQQEQKQQEQKQREQKHLQIVAERAREERRQVEIAAQEQRQLAIDREKETRQLPQASTRNCPFCAEEILAAAKKCKHCGEFLDPNVRQQQELPVKNRPSPGVAAVLSLVIPGAGQMYKGNVGSGFVWLIAVVIGYAMMVIPGLVLHVICIVMAASDD